MRIPVDKLPEPIKERLLALQADPSAYDGFFRREGGRGWAIFWLVMTGMLAAVLLIVAANEYIPLPVALISGAVLGIIVWASVGRLRLFGRAVLKPAVFVNPLYFARITLDHVTFHGLWSELKNLNIVHHHTNGVYSYTNFEFGFERGKKEQLAVSPKHAAESLADLIENYRLRMVDALENEDFGAIVANDLFLEVRLEADRNRPPRFSGGKAKIRRRRLVAVGAGAAVGAVLGFGLFCMGYAAQQSKLIKYCYRVSSCERYFERDFAVRLYDGKARDKLTASYKRQWRRDKKSVRKLRRMAELKKVRFVTPAQEKVVLALWVGESKKQLRARYQKAIDKYKRISANANPTARAALLKMLELARDKGYYRVRVTYRGVTEQVKTLPKLRRKLRGRRLSPMGPSFTAALNRSRERLITDRIERAFKKIVPQDVLEFPSARRRAKYGRYSSRTRRRSEASAIEADDKQLPAELEFKVGYAVFPSGSIYVSRKNPLAAYVGVGFGWLVKIAVKGKELYRMQEKSFPPPRFSVSSYGRRYSTRIVGAGTVYSKMATTAFDNFSRKIVRHFGIGSGRSRRASSYRSRKVRRYAGRR